MPEAQPAPRGKGRAAAPKAAPQAQAPASAPAPEGAAGPKTRGKGQQAAAPAPEARPAARAKTSAPAPASEAAAPAAKGKGGAKAASAPASGAPASAPRARGRAAASTSAPEGEAPAPRAKGRGATRGEAPAPAPKARAQGEAPAPRAKGGAAQGEAPAREPRPKAKQAPKARPAEAAPQAAPVVCLPPRDLLDRRLAPRRAVADVEPLRGKITKEDIGLLPLGAWCGEIVIVDTPRAAEAAARDMRAETVLGFDTESRPAFMKGRYYLPSLIQMATTETVYIYMLGRLAFPDSLMAIFEDPSIIKTGVAVRDDVKDLQRITPFAARGFIDLGVVALYHKLDTHGLRNLAAKFLGIRISKAARCTNWANPRLTPAQINYAATDAWISRELFLAMDREGLIDPARDYDNGNGVPEQAKDSKTRARVRRGGRSRRR
nr:3'-5' exonuclease [Desulfocurvus vexinensis]